MPKPTLEDVRKITAQFTRGADEDFFFNNLSSPVWLDALVQADFFKKPPAPQEKGENIHFPSWAQSRYLARVARLAPKEFVEIALKIPHTDNPQVLHDLFELALAVPPAEAKRLMVRLTTPTKYRANHEARRKYAAHLAEGGFAAEALTVIQLEIGFSPDPEQAAKEELHRQQKFGARLEPKVDVSPWDLDKIAEEVLPKIVSANPLLTIKVIAKELAKGVCFSRWPDEAATGEDLSFLWRPSISTHEQNRHPELLSRYVKVLRNVCEEAIGKEPGIFQSVDEILASHPWVIFERLRIHLATLFPEAAGAARLREIARDKRFFDGVSWKREYTVFLGAHFASLLPEDQDVILEWVQAGPNAENEAHWKERIGDDEENLKKCRASWRIQHLQAFKDALPQAWKDRYESWLKDGGGEDAHLGFSFWVGPVENYDGARDNPISVEKLREIGVAGTLGYLREWKPSGTFMGAERHNLASVLGQHVKEVPELYAEAADQFASLAPEYVSVLVRTLAEAFCERKIAGVEPVLRLMELITRDHGRAPESPDEDDGWDYTRLEVARFLEKILPLNPPVFSGEHRQRIWSVLSVLATDPNPSAEKELRDGRSGFNAYSASLNRTRGTALHAVIDYAVWVKQFVFEGKEFTASTELPELVALLADRLNPVREPTLMARTVLGRSFPILLQLDRAFAESLRPSIFPADDPERFWAAWDSYVVSWRVGRDMLEALPLEYDLAVERLRSAEMKKGISWDPHLALGNQLLRLYAQGALSQEAALWQKFLKVASAEVMAHIFGEMGRALKNTSGPVNADFCTRLVTLWESRAPSWQADSKRGDTEAAAFCWWFASGKFEQGWATRQMLAALKRVGTTSMDYMVLEQFADQVNETPVEAAEAVLILALSAQKTGRFFYADKRARKILHTAGQHPDAKVRERAREVRDSLLALKYESFRDVLERPPGAND